LSTDPAVAVATPADIRRAPLPAGFLLRHAWLPLAVFVALIATIQLTNADWHLATFLYASEGGDWALRKAFLTETLIHRRGHDLSIVLWAGTLVAWLVSLRNPRLRAWRRPLGYLLLAVAASTLAISTLKAVSNMDCPWDVSGLGGTRPHLTLFDLRPHGLPRGRCFPAGHASGGYAWMALYFALLMVRPRWRWFGLAAGAGVGLVYGIAQQLRGAHFLSHDLWTIAICWSIALVLYVWLRPAEADGPAEGGIPR